MRRSSVLSFFALFVPGFLLWSLFPHIFVFGQHSGSSTGGAVTGGLFSAECQALTSEEMPSSSIELLSVYTHHRADGNRLVAGSGTMPTVPLDITLAGRPHWVVAAPTPAGSIWVVILDDGQAQVFQVEGGAVSDSQFDVSMLPPEMPPVLQVVGDRATLLIPGPEASDHTNPVALQNGRYAYVDTLGRLCVIDNERVHILAVNALPDARILMDEQGRLLLLSGPTESYPHGVLGDTLEATMITLIATDGDPRVIRVIEIEPGDVIEGTAPIWVDLDGDGAREIIVTQSNSRAGARIVIYNEDGTRFASGEPIGQGFRWRHQLAVGQFIEGGLQEIAVVRTPHIGGVIEVYAVNEDRLTIQAELSGYSSHQIGSRNLDSALAADFDGDGRLEIVVPDQAQTALAGIQYTDMELDVVWEVPLGGRLTTNLAAIRLADGRLALGAGHDRNQLRLWLPE